MSKAKTNKKDEKMKTENTAKAEDIKEENNQKREQKPESEPEQKEETDSWQTKYLRLMADFQNYKKRVENEKSGIYARANERIIVDLLNVIDNFDRALESANEGVDKKFVEGVELIYKQLLTVLQNEGIEEIKALGEDFDPNFHNAVMTAPSEEYDEGKVSEVLQKGYTLKGKVVRPSMVKVVG